jgi:hypothetical protein
MQSVPPHHIPPRSILILSTHLRLGLTNGLFPSCFPTNIYIPLLPHSCYMPYPSSETYRNQFIFLEIYTYIHTYCQTQAAQSIERISDGRWLKSKIPKPLSMTHTPPTRTSITYICVSCELGHHVIIYNEVQIRGPALQ